jgi:peptidylprolyl isomerase
MHRSRKSRKPILIVGLLVAVAAITIVAYIVINSGSSSGPTSSKNKVLLTTSMGNITIQLRDDMPITTGNFKNLVQQGKYDGTTFHRIIADFMIQGGQINSSWPSIQDEFGSNNHNVNGTIAMAKTNQSNSASSQFFINVVDNSNRYATFDTTYSVFGDVIQGMDVADAISKVATDQNGNPLQSVTLIKAELID